jgi:hypothetical protein
MGGAGGLTGAGGTGCIPTGSLAVLPSDGGTSPSEQPWLNDFLQSAQFTEPQWPATLTFPDLHSISPVPLSPLPYWHEYLNLQPELGFVGGSGFVGLSGLAGMGPGVVCLHSGNEAPHVMVRSVLDLGQHQV